MRLVAIFVTEFSGFLVVNYFVTWFSNSGRFCPKLLAEQPVFCVKRALGNVTTPILFKQILITTCAGQECSSQILSRLKAWNFFRQHFY